MADFTVTSAGGPTDNGDYTESGIHGGKPAYVLNPGGAERWLYFGHIIVPSQYGWVLDFEKILCAGWTNYAYYYGQGAQATPPEGTYTDGSADGDSDAEVAAAPGVEYSNASGFDVVVLTDEATRAAYGVIAQPVDIVFATGEVVRGPYHDVGEPFDIVVTPEAIAHTLRGGGQSTTEWDWVRGKVK